ncbi:MAG TPA: NADH-quinone oxidoreductase subunit NuoG, partial [Terriglobales bacterium]|nr:NADH-quinone oxidoreductase subunit NuoG [Terriglobales bacterium]
MCLSLGLDLPYFCWHPALGSVGACRQCAIKQFKDEKDTQGRIVMACMTPAAEGSRVAIEDPEAKSFRAAVIEWLMLNHPHDCPICDEGGECHLQDMTVMTGHVYRKFRFPKRTYHNQDLGPFINHEMNRCIQCYRCVRFYCDYAGGRDLHAMASRDRVYFGRHEDGTLENEFSGNLVEVCPTGVFTDKTLKQHYTRKWDLQNAPTLCVHCGVGCNLIGSERYGQLRRIRNRYNREVNGYFICDRGRFGYEFVNSPKRLRNPRIGPRGDKPQETINKTELLEQVAPLLAKPRSIVGIGSPRASLEANFALRALVGAENFYEGLSDTESRVLGAMMQVLKAGAVRSASLLDVECSDAVLILGEDLTNDAPRLALAVRQSVMQQPRKAAARLNIPQWNDAAIREAVQGEKGPLFIAHPYPTKLADVATATCHAAPADIARLGFAVAHAVNPEAPEVVDLVDREKQFAARAAQSLAEAERPLVISGSGLGSEAIIHGAANVALALSRQGRNPKICFTTPECNSLGLKLMGGGPLQSALASLANGPPSNAVVLENDLYHRAGAGLVKRALENAQEVVFIGSLDNETSRHAGFVLPASTFAESSGTMVNHEGRAQRFYSVFAPEHPVQEAWKWLRDLMAACGRTEYPIWQDLDDLIDSLATSFPELAGVREAAPPASLRLTGRKIPRQPHRYSGRTSKSAQLDVHEPKPPEDPDSALAYSMEGSKKQPPPALTPFFWAPGWNSVQAVGKFQKEIGGELRGDTPGQRIFEPREGAILNFFTEIPKRFTAAGSDLLLVPIHHIFGSDELSLL